MTEDELLAVLRTSDRWGVNEQPLDPAPLAHLLASLPCQAIQPKGNDAFAVSFSRSLTSSEADTLVEVAAQEASPFAPGRPMLEAFLWWD